MRNLGDTSKPGGTPRKLPNVDKLRALGIETEVGLREKTEHVYKQVFFAQLENLYLSI